ncbi:MAG: hypothetical protein KDC38_08065 [Planctomycetes bacterium]|nr:hypothetical protein [Planctomycetota bacterium]
MSNGSAPVVHLCHVGLGPMGRRILGDFIRRGLGDVVAAIDSDPELVGRRLPEFVPGAPDLEVLASIDEMEPTRERPIALVTTCSDLPRCFETFIDLLERGVDLVSSCEELLYPTLRHPRLAEELDRVAHDNDCRILGTGINPGFLMDTMPLVATALSQRIDRIEVLRAQDASTRRVPFQAKIGATLDLEAFAARQRDGSLRHVGLGESLHLLADAIGLPLDEWDESLEPLIATEAMTCDLGPIPAGHARGVVQVARGRRADGRTIELEFRAAIGEPHPMDRIRILGEPDIELAFRGGVHGDTGTSAVVLNAIPALRAAPPGLHTMATIRPCRWWQSV